MNSGILSIYKHNIKRYNALFDKNAIDVVESSTDRNAINYLFYIIHEMYKKYGCVSCGTFDCSCQSMPKKHRFVGTHICKSPLWEE